MSLVYLAIFHFVIYLTGCNRHLLLFVLVTQGCNTFPVIARLQWDYNTENPRPEIKKHCPVIVSIS